LNNNIYQYQDKCKIQIANNVRLKD